MTTQPTEFVVKDSGERKEFASGMKRDTSEGKPRFGLLWPKGVPYEDQFMTRCAVHMTKGAKKYDARNWEKATGEEEIEHAMESAERHFQQWKCGDVDEDHAAAVVFNLLEIETIKWKMQQEKPTIRQFAEARKENVAEGVDEAASGV